MDEALNVAWAVAQITLVVVGFATIVTAPIRVFLRRPKIEIRTKRWVASAPVPWHFATVDIRNAPPPRWLPVERETAIDCRVSLEFRRKGELVLPPVQARWSARPEAIRQLPVADAGGNLSLLSFAAPELVPESTVYSLPPGGRWEEVAVAVLRDREAFAWGAESYQHGWKHPDWKLEKGEYAVRIIVEHPRGRHTAEFALAYLSDDFVQFELQPAEPQRSISA